jgi:hypothetical protein
MQIIKFVLSVFLNSVAFIGIGLLFEIVLNKFGLVRGNKIVLIISVVCTVLIKQIWLPTLSWWYFALFEVLAVTVGVNRADLNTTTQRGRWWWKLKE